MDNLFLSGTKIYRERYVVLLKNSLLTTALLL